MIAHSASVSSILGFGTGRLSLAGTISTFVENVNSNLYKCKGQAGAGEKVYRRPRLPSGPLALKLSTAGEAGRNYQLLASTDFNSTNWIPLGLMESTNSIWRLLDTGAFTNVWRFYRVEQLP